MLGDITVITSVIYVLQNPANAFQWNSPNALIYIYVNLTL